MYRHVHIYTPMYRHIKTCTDMNRPAHIDTHRHETKLADMFTHVKTCTDMLTYSYMQEHVKTHTDMIPCWHVLIWTDMYTHGTNHSDREVIQNGCYFLFFDPLSWLFCGNLVRFGRFICLSKPGGIFSTSTVLWLCWLFRKLSCH